MDQEDSPYTVTDNLAYTIYAYFFFYYFRNIFAEIYILENQGKLIKS